MQLKLNVILSGTHYFMNMSNHLPCEKIYPVFLMYNMEGYLAAFGWVFQGRPDNFYSDDGMGWFHITPLTYPVSIDRCCCYLHLVRNWRHTHDDVFLIRLLLIAAGNLFRNMSDSRETAFAVYRASFIFQGPYRVFKSSTGSNIHVAIRMHKQTDNFTHKETKKTIKRKEVSNDQELVH